MPNRPGLPIPLLSKRPILRPSGEPAWHDLSGPRFANMAPPGKNPIRGRAHREALDPTARTVDAFGTPQWTRDLCVPRS